jgi:hypothetical protein
MLVLLSKAQAAPAYAYSAVADGFKSATGVDTANSTGVSVNTAGGYLNGADTSTLALFHFNGADGSTAFTEEVGGATLTPTNLTNSATQAKFGAGSAKTGSGASSLKVVKGTTFDFGTSDFTLEAFIYPTANVSNGAIFSTNSGFAAGCFAAGFGSNGQMVVDCYNKVSNNDWLVGAAGDIALNKWQHVAFVRNGLTFKGYVDGVQKVSGTLTASDAFNFSSTGNGGLVLFNEVWNSNIGTTAGYYDEVRVSNTARYTAAFTPPAAPFSTSGSIDARSVLFNMPVGPNNANLFMTVQVPNGGLNLNTNLQGFLSRDGVTDTQVTLTQSGVLSDGTIVLEANNVDISAQPAGNKLRWRVKTVSLPINITGVEVKANS